MTRGLLLIALGLYLLVTGWLAWRGARRTSGLQSYAVGNRSIPPWVVGLSLAAQLTSVATFVVNPGLVFHYGLSALLGFGVAAGAGITTGLVVFSRAFRRQGEKVAALSVPGYLSRRFQSPGLGLGFSVASLALVSYAVLIVVALALVLATLLQVPAWLPASALIAFVFATVMLGGVNSSAYTNAVQALVMLMVAGVLVGSCLAGFDTGSGGLFERLARQDAALVAVVNPGSLYFRNLFEVFACNFLVGLALTCQPHILSKALYLRTDRQVRGYLLVAVAAGLVFMAVLLVGLFARLELPASLAVDRVVPAYIAKHFSGPLQVLVTIGVLCAGISTLEGIMLALSTIVSVDLYPALAGLLAGHREPGPESARRALLVGRSSIPVFGVVTFLLAYWQLAHPTGGSVAIFAQYGVYGLTAAAFVPLAAGMFLARASRPAVVAASLAAALTYLVMAIWRLGRLANNPAYLAFVAIAASVLVYALTQALSRPAAVERAVAGPARAKGVRPRHLTLVPVEKSEETAIM